jgi:chromosome segregation ATPase
MSEESLSMIDLELANVSLSDGISELQQQLAEAQHGVQDMETKLHNECQAHERTKRALNNALAHITGLEPDNEILKETSGE